MSKEATNDYPWLHNWLLILTASFAVIWIVHRAMVQSMTVDEANTFLYWVAPDSPTHWSSESNNHVLNSTLMSREPPACASFRYRRHIVHNLVLSPR